MNRHTPVVPFAAAALSAVAAAQTFTVVGLPDTQNYSESYPAIYHLQTQWVADNVGPLDIRHVSHYGDVVNHGDSLAEWLVADSAMSTLDEAGVPYGVTAGNHDITPAGIAGSAYIPGNFVDVFGPARFAGRPWYGGASPAGVSSFQVFEGGGLTWLALHVECDGALRELEWAQGVLDAHRDKPVLLTTHRWLQDAEDYTGGVPLVPSGWYPAIWYAFEGVYAPDGLQTERIFDWFVRRNPNIVLVQCGHFHEEHRTSHPNVAGLPVHEVLADYQDDPNGGDGWLRLYAFDVAAGRIDVRTYSPFLQAFRGADESQFSLFADFGAYRSTDPVRVLQEGIGGWTGTQDTWIDQSKPDASYGESDVRVSDDDVTNSIFSDKRGQALLRFDGLVGDGPGQVPAGAQVVQAFLSLQLADDIDNPLFDPGFLVHRVLVPWSETSTWNSLGGGLSVGAELTPALASFHGDNAPDEDGLRRIDVTAAVQAWADGAANWGLAILPEVIDGNDDGIEILTSESSNPLLRPRLEVRYVAPCGYETYGLAAAPANVLKLAGLGSPALGGALQLQTSLAPSGGVFTGFAFGPAQVPFKSGLVLLDLATLGPLAFSPSPGGTALFTLPLPSNPAYAGVPICFQSFAFDSAAPQGLFLSNGVKATLCPPQAE